MPEAWDTSVASHIYAGGRHRPLLATHMRTGTPVPLPAPALQEVARGLHIRATRNAGYAKRFDAFAGLLADPLVRVLPLDDAGAVLAGRLLALLPHPPTGRRRRRGTRAQQRAAWALDVQIASCAFARGYGVLTENVGDFGVLGNEIER